MYRAIEAALYLAMDVTKPQFSACPYYINAGTNPSPSEQQQFLFSENHQRC
jgi:hypothetical protein